MPDDLGFPVRVRIGTTLGNLEDVKIHPIVEFRVAATGRRTVDGLIVAAEPPSCVWRYPDRRLTAQQYYQLKKFVGDNLSARVVIETTTQETSTTTYVSVVASYNAIMEWPTEGVEEIYKNQWVLPDEGIIFTGLTASS